MSEPLIEQTYPNIATWVQNGWIEIGYSDEVDSFIRVLDEGGLVWEGDEPYNTLDEALAAAEAAIADWTGVNRSDSAVDQQTVPPFTAKQGQYLAYIHHYTLLNGRAPAEAEMQRHFGVTPPSVHGMIIRMEENGLISRVPGEARSIRVLIPEEFLPAMDRP